MRGGAVEGCGLTISVPRWSHNAGGLCQPSPAWMCFIICLQLAGVFGVCSGLLSLLLQWWWPRWMLKDGDQREGEKEAACGLYRRCWGWRKMYPGLPGVLKREWRFHKDRAGCITSPAFPFLLLGLGYSLFPPGWRGIICAPARACPRKRMPEMGTYTSWSVCALACHDFFWLTFQTPFCLTPGGWAFLWS